MFIKTVWEKLDDACIYVGNFIEEKFEDISPQWLLNIYYPVIRWYKETKWVLYRMITNRRSDTIRIRHKDIPRYGYTDNDTKYFYGCFQLLENHAKNSHDMNATEEEMKEAYDCFGEEGCAIRCADVKELKRLLNWWKNERPARHNIYDDVPYINHYDMIKYNDKDEIVDPETKDYAYCRMQEKQGPEYDAYRENMTKWRQVQDAWDEEDQKNLESLTRLRRYLWD